MDLASIVIGFAEKYPAILTVLSVMGFCRVFMKPLFAALHSGADFTPTDADNKILDTVEKSKAFTWFSFALDYLFSVKLIK